MYLASNFVNSTGGGDFLMTPHTYYAVYTYYDWPYTFKHELSFTRAA